MPQDNTNNTEVARWYVVHTYSGYENKVKDTLEKAVENREMQHLVQEVIVPMEEQIEIKDDKRKTTLRKVFPGYVLIKMIVTEETWYIVRNTRGVTGFVGPGSKPIPLTEEEVINLGVVKKVSEATVAVGDIVNITSGALEGFEGTVKEVDEAAGTVLVTVTMFGRETPTTLELSAVEKIN